MPLVSLVVLAHYIVLLDQEPKKSAVLFFLEAISLKWQ
jgi:hypothetical protein